MPRLVSLTLLSMLVLPAGALLYTVVVVVGMRVTSWRNEAIVFLAANLLTFGLVVTWWSLLWGRRATWDAVQWLSTVIATVLSIVLGVFVGIVVLLAGIGNGFEQFVGGTATIIAWLCAVCILWHDGAASSSPRGEATTVICPKCGYALNGLREARCPECGEGYTLDALLLAQPGMRRQGDL